MASLNRPEFRLAAEQGDASGQFNLGVMYANGDGVPQSNMKAYVWWSVSAAQGHEKAKGNRDIVAAELTPDDFSKAQAVAASLGARHAVPLRVGPPA